VGHLHVAGIVENEGAPVINSDNSETPPASWFHELAVRYWFVVALLLAMAGGVAFSEPLQPLASNRAISNSVVAAVMFLMAFPLQSRALARSVTRPWATLVATAVCYGLVPLLAWIGSHWLNTTNAAGLLVASAVPCTLAMASVLTLRAGGNEAAALLTTIVTNGSCFFVTPFLVWLMLGQEADIPAAQLATTLLLYVLLPIAAGQILRLSPRLAASGSSKKKLMNIGAQTGVLFMVVMGMATTAERLEGSGIQVVELLKISLVCLAVHLCGFVGGFEGARWLGLDRGDRIAAAFSGSQKTLMAGLLICVTLKVSLLPMVTFHLIQLVVDTLIADRLARGKKSDGPGSAAPGCREKA
jgi:solute carrier family 10 (sodium/bile acid cotransporter), member 7